MGLEMFPFPPLTPLVSLCCRTRSPISRWLLKVKLSFQGLHPHLSLQSDLHWCLWILEHHQYLSWDEDLLFLPLLLLACTGHGNAFQYETSGLRALRCQVRGFCQHLFQINERECFGQVVSYHAGWTCTYLHTLFLDSPKREHLLWLRFIVLYTSFFTTAHLDVFTNTSFGWKIHLHVLFSI